MKKRLLDRKEPAFDEQVIRTCKNCSHEFQGRYCNKCGEKVVEQYERTVLHFLNNVFNAFTFIDSKFLNSFKSMLLRPGQMTLDMAEGKRQPYMKPVAFFFVGNVIYFLFPLFQTFNTSLYAQMYFMPYSEYVQQVVDEYRVANGIEFKALAEKYNSESTAWAKMLLIVIPPLFLPIAALVNYSRKFFLSDQFLFAMEFSSYLIFIPTILLPFLLWGINWMGTLLGGDFNLINSDAVTTPIIGVLILYFFVRATLTFYQFSKWRVVLSSVLMLLSMYLVVHAYRFILFIISMWTV
jgi:hypothetical protein